MLLLLLKLPSSGDELAAGQLKEKKAGMKAVGMEEKGSADEGDLEMG